MQPIFVQTSQGAIPELQRVSVFFNNQLGYTAELNASIDQGLGRTAVAPPPDGRQPTPSQASATALVRILQQQAIEYRRAQQALDRHDLGGYQRAVERLGRLIEQARQLTGGQALTSATQAASPP